MSIYTPRINALSDAFGRVASLSPYATAREYTGPTAATGTATVGVGQTGTSSFACGEYFATFNTSAVPSTQTSAIFSFWVPTVPTIFTDTIEIRVVPSGANCIAGSALGSYPLIGTLPWPNDYGQIHVPIDFSLVPRSSSVTLLMHSQKHRLGTQSTGNETMGTAGVGSTLAFDRPFINFPGSVWRFVGKSAVSTVTAVTQTLTEPAGVQQGDLLIAGFAVRTATATTMTAPSGWTLAGVQNNSNTSTNTSALPQGMMFYCVRGASPPSYAFVHAVTPSVAVGCVVAYRGNALTSPLDAVNAITTPTNTSVLNAAGVSSTQEDDLIVVVGAGGQETTWANFDAATSPIGFSAGTITYNPGAFWAEREDWSTTTGSDTSLGIFDAVKPNIGPTGNLRCDLNTPAGNVIISAAFKMAPQIYGVTVTPTGQSLYASVGRARWPGDVNLWTPAELGTEVIAWYDFADTPTVVQSGGFLTQWRDKSGNSRHGNALSSTTVNINSDGIYVSQAATVNACVQLPTFPSAYFDFAFAGKPNPAGSYRTLLAQAAGGQHHLLIETGTNNLGTYAATWFQAGSLTWPSVDGQVYYSAASSSTVQIGKDGGALVAQVGENFVPDAAPVMFNYSLQGLQGWGTAREFVFLNSGQSQETRDKLAGYLAWKWDGILGVTTHVTALPFGHPYKDAPPTIAPPSPHVTVSVTGQELTTAVGQVTVATQKSVTVVPTGQSLTTSVGTVLPQLLPTAFDWRHVDNIASLSNNYRTLSYATVYENVDTVTPHATGKYYIEFRLNAITGWAKVWVDEYNIRRVAIDNTGVVTFGGTTGYTTSPLNAGDIVGIAVDLTNNLAWIRVNNGIWNNSATANPGTNTEGKSLGLSNWASYGVAEVGSAGTSITVNTGPTFVNAIPAGFASWFAPPTAVSVSVTGQALTTSVGTVTPTGKATVVPTGQAVAASVGTVTVTGKIGVTVVPTGQTLTTGVGQVTVSGAGAIAVGVTGQEITAQVGQVTVTGTAGVTVIPAGQAVTASVGAVTPTGKANVSVTGQAITASVGTVTPLGDANVVVTGQTLTTGIGQVTVNTTRSVVVVPAGQTMTAGVGQVTPIGKISVNVVPTGQGLTTQVGNVTILAGGSITVPVIGQALTVALGTVTIPAPVVDDAGKAKIWTGSAWGYKPVKYWSGSDWITKPLKIWNGTAWVAYPLAGTGPGLVPLRFKSISSTTYASRTSVTVPAPSLIKNGDLLVAVGVAQRGGVDNGANWLYPPVGMGWQMMPDTQVYDGSQYRVRLQTFWKRANNEAGSYTFGVVEEAVTEMAIAAYEGVLENGNPIDAFATFTPTSAEIASTINAPSITTTLPNELLLILGHDWINAAEATPPTGYTERLDDLVQWFDNTNSGAAGATGNKPYVVQSTPAWWQSRHIAIKPATGAVGSYVSPQYRSSLYTSYSSGRVTTVVGKPAGTLENDILIASLFQGYSADYPVDPSPPDGTWVKIGTSIPVTAGGFQGKFTVWWKRAGPSEPVDYTFTQDGNAYSTQLMLASYMGCPTTGSPIDVFSQNGGVGSVATALGVIPTQDNDRLIYLGHNWDASQTLTPPFSYDNVDFSWNGKYGQIERIDHLTYLSDEIWTLASPTINRRQDLAGSGGWAAFLIGLKGIAGAVAVQQPFTLRQSAVGGSSLATTIASFPIAPVAGNLIVLGFSAEDINSTPNLGWTQSSGMEMVNYHGGYTWWRMSDGSNSLQYTIQSAVSSRWVLMEFEGPFDASPYDLSAGQNAVNSINSYATPTITPTVGNRLLIAGWGWTRPGGFNAPWSTSVTNDFSVPVESSDTIRSVAFNMSYRIVGANGTDSYSSTSSMGYTTAAQSGQIISFKGA